MNRIDEVRGLGFMLMKEADRESAAWELGYQLNLFGLSMQNAVDPSCDESWVDTAILHAQNVMRIARLRNLPF